MKCFITVHEKQYFTVSSTPRKWSNFLLETYEFNRKLVTFKKDMRFDKTSKRYKTSLKVNRKFYVIDEREKCLRYPIAKLDEFKKYLEERDIKFTIDYKQPPKGQKELFNINPEFEPRDYQLQYINAILKNPNFSFLVDLKTGGGKTFIACYSLAKLGKRFGILILPTYIPKWIEDLKKNLLMSEDEIYVVQGSASLRTLLSMTKKELKENNIKTIIFSLKTIINYINEWLDKDTLFTYPVKPDELTYKLDMGYMLGDEVHQEFHNVYLTQLFFNTNMLLGLSATLEHNDKRTAKMYEILFPKENRLQDKLNFKKYINVISLRYYFRNPKKIKWQTKFGYSHVKLEQSILKDKNMLDNYVRMIYNSVKGSYLNRRKEEDKCLIFAATIDMCNAITEKLKSLIPDLNVNKYTQEDDYEVLMKSDIIVSTLKSSGTAVDIPNLITVIQTIAIDSIQANKQSIGRLRELKNKEVVFVYLWSANIPSHIKYSIRRNDYFAHIAKKHFRINYIKEI